MDDFAEKLSAANKASQDAALSVSAGTVNASVALVAKLFQPEGGSLRSGPEFGTLKRECMVLIKATVNRLVLQDKSIGDDSGGQDNSSAISAAAAGLRFLAGLMEDPSLVIIVWQELFRIANHRPGIFRAAVQVADLGAELADSLQRTATHWCTDVLSMAGCMMQQQQQPPKPAVVAKTAKMMTMLAKYQASYVRTFGRWLPPGQPQQALSSLVGVFGTVLVLRPLSSAASSNTAMGSPVQAVNEATAACINEAEAVAAKFVEPLGNLLWAPIHSAEDAQAMDACRWALLQGLVPGDRNGHSGSNSPSSPRAMPPPLPLPSLPSSISGALFAAGRLAVLVEVAEAWAKSSASQVLPERAIELASLIASAAELVPDSCGKGTGRSSLWARAGAATGALWAIACRPCSVNGMPHGCTNGRVHLGPSLEALLLALADPHPRAHAIAHAGALAWLHHLPTAGEHATSQQLQSSQHQLSQKHLSQRPSSPSARAAAVRFLARAASSPRCEPELARHLCLLLASALDLSSPTNELKGSNRVDLEEAVSSVEAPLFGAAEFAALIEHLPSTQALRFELLTLPPPVSNSASQRLTFDLPVPALRLLVLVLARPPALFDDLSFNGSSVGWRVGSSPRMAVAHRCHEYAILCHELLHAFERSMISEARDRALNLSAILDLALVVLAPSSTASLPAAAANSAASSGHPQLTRAWCAPRLESPLASVAAKYALAGVARAAEAAAAASAAAYEGAGQGNPGRSKLALTVAAVEACNELAAALARLRRAAAAQLPGLDSLALVAALRSALTRLDRGRARCGGLNPLKSQQLQQQQLQHRSQQPQQPIWKCSSSLNSEHLSRILPGSAVAASLANVLVESCLCLASLVHAIPAPASDELVSRSACGPPPPTLAKEASELARLLASACPLPQAHQLHGGGSNFYGSGGQGGGNAYNGGGSSPRSAVHWTGALRLALAALAASRRPDTSLVGDAFAPLVGGWPSPPPPSASAGSTLRDAWWASILCGTSANSNTSDVLDVSSTEAMQQHAHKRRRDVATNARAVESSRRPRTASWAPPGSSSNPWGAAPAPRGGAFEIGLLAGQGVPSLCLNGRTLKVTFEYDLGEQSSAQPFPEGAYSVALQGMREDGAGGASARLLLS